MRSVMGRNLRWAAGCEIGDQRRAYVRASAAAVLEEEKRNLAEADEIGAVDDGTAVTFALHQTRACEHSQVSRHGVLWNFHVARQLTSGHAVRFTADQQPKRVEPG